MLLIFGSISAITGTYGFWLEITGEYEKMGLLFFPWVILQTPVFFVALLFGATISISYLITFFWWFLLGSCLVFVFIFLLNYFESIYIE
jgi:hypothetical protein